jgi:uncharacterized membrane protein
MSILKSTVVAAAVLVGLSSLATAAPRNHHHARAQAQYQADNGSAAQIFQDSFKNNY